jgi:hypothetical protein
VPGNFTAPACYANQTAVDEAFAAWLAQASFTGGCNASMTDNHGSAPSRCGGNVTVTWNVSSSCEGDVVKSATFTIPVGCCVSCGTACAAESVGVHNFTGASSWFTYIEYHKGDGNITNPAAYPIYYGKTHLAGTLYVYNNATTLFVRYTIDDMNGCEAAGISSYHLQVDKLLSLLRQHILNNKNPVPGRCEYKNEDVGGVLDTGWITAYKANDNLSGMLNGSTIYIFAHLIACYSCP